MAEALYRKYRPTTFRDIVGQEHIERTLKNAIEQDKVSHAYLFCGPRGTGKTTTARILAKALLCEKGPTTDPDGTCQDCQAIANGNHPDVYELDAASRTGVENVREEIISRVHYAPTRGKAKVYIIDEVHMLTVAAFNALLKTLEEPPDHVVFILCTTDPQKVPETIHSRCQRFDFHRISVDAIVARLGAICVEEGVEFEPEALELIAYRSDGGMRNALTSLEQLIAFGEGKVTLSGAQNLLGSVDNSGLSEIVVSIGAREAGKCFTWVAHYVETGADLAQFVSDLAEHFRNLYLMRVTEGNTDLLPSGISQEHLKEELKYFSEDRLSRILGILDETSKELRVSTNPRLSFEIALTRMVRPDSDLTLEALAERVEVLEKRLSGKVDPQAYVGVPVVQASQAVASGTPGSSGSPLQNQMPMGTPSQGQPPVGSPLQGQAPAGASLQNQMPVIDPSKSQMFASESLQNQMPAGSPTVFGSQVERSGSSAGSSNAGQAFTPASFSVANVSAQNSQTLDNHSQGGSRGSSQSSAQFASPLPTKVPQASQQAPQPDSANGASFTQAQAVPGNRNPLSAQAQTTPGNPLSVQTQMTPNSPLAHNASVAGGYPQSHSTQSVSSFAQEASNTMPGTGKPEHLMQPVQFDGINPLQATSSPEPLNTPSGNTSSGTQASGTIDLSNPAKLQRTWHSIVSHLRKVNPARGVLFMNARVSATDQNSTILVEFGADSGFAYTAAQKPEVRDLLKESIRNVVGFDVPFQLQLAGSSPSSPVGASPSPVSSVASSPVASTVNPISNPAGASVANASFRGGSPSQVATNSTAGSAANSVGNPAGGSATNSGATSATSSVAGSVVNPAINPATGSPTSASVASATGLPVNPAVNRVTGSSVASPAGDSIAVSSSNIPAGATPGSLASPAVNPTVGSSNNTIADSSSVATSSAGSIAFDNKAGLQGTSPLNGVSSSTVSSNVPASKESVNVSSSNVPDGSSSLQSRSAVSASSASPLNATTDNNLAPSSQTTSVYESAPFEEEQVPLDAYASYEQDWSSSNASVNPATSAKSISASSSEGAPSGAPVKKNTSEAEEIKNILKASFGEGIKFEEV